MQNAAHKYRARGGVLKGATMQIIVEFRLDEQELEKLRKTAEDMRKSGIEDSENYSIADEIRFIVSKELEKPFYEREVKEK